MKFLFKFAILPISFLSGLLILASGRPTAASYLTGGLTSRPIARLFAPKLAALPLPPQSASGPPNAPILFAPANGSGGASTSPVLDVSVTDPAGSDLTVTFYGRVAGAVGPSFTLIPMPDTQYYSAAQNGGTPAMFNTQSTWIANNKIALNLAYVAHLGDIVQSANNNGVDTEWINADSALRILENAGVPFGLPPGNHDEGANINDIGNTPLTASFNKWFGVSRFAGRSYYGGHYSTTNDNHYDLFSAGGMEFIVIYFAYDTSTTGTRFQGILAWADALLKQHANRRAILVSHYILNSGNPATFGAQGQTLFNALRNNPNLFLLLSGHIHSPTGQGRRSDTVNGNVIQSVMSDFQGLTNGGNGWLRVMTFSPAANQIQVQTYSPVLNQYMTDSANQFTLPLNMQNSGYTNLGGVSVLSGNRASLQWDNLTPGTRYEWYAVASSGTLITTGPIWDFTTTALPAPQVSLAPVSLSFPSQPLNVTSAPLSVQLTNTGNASLNIASIVASGDYSQTNACGSPLAAGGFCAITVIFTPTATGARNGSLVITDDAAGSPHTVNLFGTGFSPAPIITSANSATFTAGVAGTFTVTATGSPAPAFSESGALPTGVTFNAAGLLSGTPAAGTAGSYPIAITAQNGFPPNANQAFTLTVVAPAPPPPPPVLTGISPNSGQQTQSLSATLTGANFLAGAACGFGAGITINSCTVNSSSQVATNISISGSAATGARSVIVTNSDGQVATLTNAFTVNTPAVPTSLFTTQVPTVLTDSDGVVEDLGTVFTSVVPGQITAIRFWKGSSEAGTHTGRIWSGAGQLLTSVAFANETASGWQQQVLSAPLSILANTNYVVTVSTGSNTFYANTPNGLTTQVVNGDLRSVVGNNGVYGPPGQFPTNTGTGSWQKSNYFRDIVFIPGTTYSITGTISPTPNGSGATVTLSGAASATTTTDGSGNYSFTGLANGSYTVTPGKTGFTFSPASLQAPVSNANVTGINFTIAPIPTYSITGTISPTPNGSGATVTLSGAASATTTTDGSGNYSFTGLANGSYTVTPSKSGFTFSPLNQAVTISSANRGAINFTAAASTGITIDATAFGDKSTAAKSVTTAAFSTTAGNELLLAMVGADVPTATGANNSVTGVTGAGLTWVLVRRTNTERGTAEIWRAFAPAPLTNVTVTANLAISAVSSITVMSFRGVNTSGTNGSGAIGNTGASSGATGTLTASLVTLGSNSLVVGGGEDWNAAPTVTAGPNQTVIHQLSLSGLSTFWAQRQNATTPASGTTVTINQTAPTNHQYNLTICEIMAAP